MTKTEQKAEDRGFARGIAVACSTMQESHDQPTMIAEVLRSCGFETRAKLKRAGAEEYDLELLRPVFDEIRGGRR